MYQCNNCQRTFEEPEIENTTYENFYGVSNNFQNSTPMELEVCPICGSDDISSVSEDYEEESEE